jgi:subtilisin-like proprotein convertase family protein
MRRLLGSLVPAACLLAAPAAAQAPNLSLRLNDPAPAGQYLSVADKTGLEDLPAMTIEAWVYPTASGGIQTIVGNDHATSFWLAMQSDGKVLYRPTGGASSVTSGAALALGRWTHVAATYSQTTGTARIYLNGAISASQIGLTGTTGNSAGDLRIGADFEAGAAADFWQGCLDEVRIWNQTVSSARLAEDRFHRGGTSSDAGGYYAALVANWTFDFLPAGGAYFTDERAGRHATRVNAPALETGIRPQLDYCTALQLDGVSDYAALAAAPDLAAGLTVEAWIYPTGFAGTPTIAGRDYETGSWLGLTNAGKLRFYPKGGIGLYLDSNAAVPLNQWTHVAAVYRDGFVRLLIDGVVDRATPTAFGAIVDNGRAFFIGADDNAGGPANFFFKGRLDEVRILGGARSTAQIREAMFYPAVTDNLLDEDGVARPLVNGHCEPSLPSGTTHGSSAHWVQSGAPLYDEPGPGYRADLGGIFMRYTGKEIANGSPSELEDTLSVPLSSAIDDVNVFVDLEFARGDGSEGSLVVQLLPPTGGGILELFSGGPAPGRDLQTEFDDESPYAIEDLLPPFLGGVRPRDALGGLDGRGAAGLWRLRVQSGTGTVRCRLNQWGVQINGINTVSAPAAAPPGGVRLALAGSNPLRGVGRLDYLLPAAAALDLAVYDLRGARLVGLASGWQAAGPHRVQWDASRLAPGVYFAQLAVDGRARARVKLVVVE